MAPYAMAHLKLGMQLSGLDLKEDQQSDWNYNFESNDRLGIYLTNTLEEAENISKNLYARYMAEEANAAASIKREMPIMVVMGNPPYSGHSDNKGKWINDILRDYYFVDGKPLGERNPKWLQDDYVKFIRFGQWRIEKTGAGVLAFITNHGYLDNPTFRGMRQQLMKTFSDIYILDLHGNAKKKETCPDKSKDENVFDIQQGVSIGIFIKRRNNPKTDTESSPLRGEGRGEGDFPQNVSPLPLIPSHEGRGNLGEAVPLAKIRHAQIWGTRALKYPELLEKDLSSTDWREISPQSPYYLFTPQNVDLQGEYEKGWKITDVFPVNGVGMTTARDHVVIDFEKKPILERAAQFRDSKLSDEETCKKLNIPLKTGWNVANARKLISKENNLEQFIKPILYRPFDDRLIFYHDSLVWRTVKQVMRHMLAGDNLGLISARSNKSFDMNHFFCAKFIMETKCGESTTQSCLFPLYLYPDPSKGFDFEIKPWPAGKGGRWPNLNPEVVAEFEKKLNLKFIPDGRGDLIKTFGPEDIFHYIYAVFHSPTYRSRYAESLRIDFPRLPLTSNVELFRALCARGADLAALHLMEDNYPAASWNKDQGQSPLQNFTAGFPVRGTNIVEKPEYKDGRVYINKADSVNKAQYFDNIPSEVWEFQVGGYRVCEKWLKDRKGRSLSYDDQRHYQRIVAALRETIAIMSEIDELIPGWPIS